MGRYIIRRLLQAIPLLFIISIVIFLLLQSSGDPLATIGWPAHGPPGGPGTPGPPAWAWINRFMSSISIGWSAMIGKRLT